MLKRQLICSREGFLGGAQHRQFESLPLPSAALRGAGLFAAVGPAAVVVLDATTFLLAAIALACMRVREAAREPSRTSVADATAGLRHIWSTPILRRLILAALVSVLGFGFAETALYAVVDVGLHRPPAFLGVLMGIQGGAAIAAGVMAAPVLRRIGEPRLCATGLALFAMGCPLLAMPNLPAVLLGYVLLGTGIPWAVVAQTTLLQRMTRPAMQGRAFGALDMVTAVPHVAAIAGGAILIATVDYRVVLGVMTVLLLGGAIEIAAVRNPGSRPSPGSAGSSREEGVEGRASFSLRMHRGRVRETDDDALAGLQSSDGLSPRLGP
jgi:hypothetical protein